MGVQGLWSLLQPAARPIKLEDLEGKRFAVDSSIWLYHFRMAMRDKEGRTLANAHILGFFWRICKLLHFGLRPVFVFDGGAPVMKRQTLIGRKNRRAGAKESHALAAKKLLNVQLRQAAVEHVAVHGDSNLSSTRREGEDNGESGLGENVAYFDDYETEKTGATPLKYVRQRSLNEASNSPAEAASPSKATVKKKVDYHRDPYALPELDQDIYSMTASSSRATDPRGKGGARKGRRTDFRFATDAELRHLVNSITPSDIDMSSPLFRSLPSELQYELVGDMRAASRGTSYKRLQAMLKASPTPIDFSRAQIANLKNRNELTQRVLEVTNEIGDAHIKVPIRVAGDRNREYVLVRREGDEGGFVLGVRNKEGTSKEKAIVIGDDPEPIEVSSDGDQQSDSRTRASALRKKQREDDDDLELDEVEVPQSAPSMRSVSVRSSRSPLDTFRASDANNPEVRRALAEQLLSKRVEEHVKQKMRQKGVVNEDEILEEQLRAVHERLKFGGSGGDLFLNRFQQHHRDKDNKEEADSSGDDDVTRSFANALAAYYHKKDSDEDERAGVETPHQQLPSAEPRASSDLASPVVIEDFENEHAADEACSSDMRSMNAVDEQPPLENFDASEYTALYDSGAFPDYNANELPEGNEMEDVAVHTHCAPKSELTMQQNEVEKPYSIPIQEARPAPYSWRSDRSALTGRMNLKLFERREWFDDSEYLDADFAEKDSPLRPKNSVSDTSNKFSPNSKQPINPTKKLSSSPLKSSSLEAASALINSSRSKKPYLVAEFRRAPGKEKASVVSEQSNDIAQTAQGQTQKSLRAMTEDQQYPGKFDSKGRPMSDTEPLPRRHDLAATEILSDDPDETSDGHLNHVLIKEDPSTTRQIVDAPSAAEFSELMPSEEQSQKTAGVGEQDLPAEKDDTLVQDLDLSVEIATRRSMEDRPRTVEAMQSQSARLRASQVAPKNGETGRAVLSTKTNDTASPTFSNAVSALNESHRHASPEPPLPVAPESGRYESDEGTLMEWSPSPSPELPILGADGFPLPTAEELEQMDTEREKEAQALGADQNDIASFISSAKGQGLIEAQAQLAREVEALKAEHINTKRSEEEITRQMAREIQMMLRLFGLPYITAPMEAEAQCAELVNRKLVDGIITDDSDVFLFGGTRVYKNMFNNNKVVECFLLSDIQRELGLDREKLVRLAYLLGSDYTEGLPSVGPVMAMEVLSLFTGPDGLLRFKDWWLKVQSGKDTPEDTKGKTMRRIKKTLVNKLHLNDQWPNPAVLDAYYEPSVDTSDEPFQWGLPDLDNLRAYLRECLGWSTAKTDQYVVPVIEAQSRRSRSRGNQSTLDRNGFFDVSGGTRVYAGRTVPKYGSSRLQNVVDGFRAANQQRIRRAGGGKRAHEQQSLVQRDRIQITSSYEDEEESAAAADLPLILAAEEAIGKEMAKSRPIVQEEQMRVTRNEAQKDLDANIVALEGDKGLINAAPSMVQRGRKRKTAPTRASDGVKGQLGQPQVEDADQQAARSDRSSDSYGDEVGQPGWDSRPSKAARGHGASTISRIRSHSKARGGSSRASAGSKAQEDHQNVISLAPESTSPQTSAAPERASARKPARARGVRRRDERHPHLVAGRAMRLDGPIPKSIAEPIRPGRYDRYFGAEMTSRSTSASSFTLNTVPPSAEAPRESSRGSQSAAIELDSESDGDE